MADSHSHSTEKHADTAHDTAHQGHGDYLHHVRPYLVIGGMLFIFTVITVGLSYVDFDKLFNSHGMNIIIGLIVATFKVCLVAAWFMHLKSENGTIWKPLLFTLFFCLGLFVLCLLAYLDPIHSTSHPLH